MNILTVEKKILDLTTLDSIEYDTRFTVIDFGSDANKYSEPDIIFPKLLYVEDYTGPALECMIDNHVFVLPLAWFIFIGDEDISEIEALPLTSLNARNFSVITTNPIDGSRHHYKEIKILNVYPDYDWVLPKIKNGQCIAVPYNNDSDNPMCVYITHSTSKIPNILSPVEFI